MTPPKIIQPRAKPSVRSTPRPPYFDEETRTALYGVARMLITNGDREVRAKFSVLNQRFEAAPGEPKRDLLVALQGFDVTPVNAALVLRNLNFVHASHLRENLVAPVFSYADLDTRFHLAKTRKNAFALWRQA